MLYDISPLLSPRLAVWPGDTPFSHEILRDIAKGDIVTLSTLRATAHVGAHADAPNHYGRGAPAIHERSLDLYLGRCQVVHVDVERGSLIDVHHVSVRISSPRVLLASGTYPNPEQFNPDFAALSPELVDWLHEQGVTLVGVDTPSVDPFDSKTLSAHLRFLKHDMSILESLVLVSVPDGVYELIALPLKLEGFDASPVRAVLRSVE